MATDPFTSFSHTKRIVLLIDLNPLLLHFPNPNPNDTNSYLQTLLSTTKTLLLFPPLASSLFSFKLFFSSLSPLLSSSKLPNSSLHLSFNDPKTTLHALSQTLDSLSSTFQCHNTPNSNSDSNLPPRAAHVAASMRQLLHDYSWDLDLDGEEGFTGTSDRSSSSFVRSNLVVLFSPISRSRKWICEFLGLDVKDDALLCNSEALCEKFSSLFNNVNDAYVSKDIHFSWVDVKHDTECGVEEEVVKDGIFESGIRSLGWGYCSTELIVLGSALVPFGLIYPRIIVRPDIFRFSNNKSVRASLDLEIVDVSGKPLDCKCCELELISLKLQQRCSGILFPLGHIGVQGGESSARMMNMDHFIGSLLKLQVDVVLKQDESVKLEGLMLEPMIVREYLGEYRKDRKHGSDCEFFADRVLQLLAEETGEFVRKSQPLWQILLSFMYREGYSALVSLYNGNGECNFGILKPLTISLALIYPVDKKPCLENIVQNVRGGTMLQSSHKPGNRALLCNDDDVLGTKNIGETQPGSQSDKKDIEVGDCERRKNRNCLQLHQNLTWTAFHEKAFEGFEVKLEELFLVRKSDNSKKLKFFKCWMKQVKSSTFTRLHMFDGSKSSPNKVINETPAELNRVSEQPMCASASIGEDSLTAASRVQDDAVLDNDIGSSEDFISNIPSKIHAGLESEGVDLGALAERLVKSTIYWLYQKYDTTMASGSQSPKIDFDCAAAVSADLPKLLLKEPKDLSRKNKIKDASEQRSDLDMSACSIKEYELQILFRLEILRSEIGATIEEPLKQKFVKQICLFLDSIQCHMEGGFFGDWNLNDYVGRIIKGRYAGILEDVVYLIYSKMDLLLLEDDGIELNSEGSSQSWRDRTTEDVLAGNLRHGESRSVENESPPPMQDGKQLKGGEHMRRLIEARERRERARRFASLTSWVPDLQRVWAPKHPHAMKAKSNHFTKLSKRKERRKVTCDMVCETPMTTKKRTCQQTNNKGDQLETGNPLCRSVSKVLFMDD